MTDVISPVSTGLSTTSSSPVPRFRDAYERLLDAIRNVPAANLIPINIDIPTAVTTALGSLPEIRALRPRVVAEMPQFDIDRFDKLEAYTLAAGHAHALFLAASEPAQAIEELSAAAITTRQTLFADASALAMRDLLDGQRLRDLKGSTGFRNQAFDLLTLAALLREMWPTIAGKTALDLTELDKAEMLADRLLTAVGLREQGPAMVAAQAEIRQRAFALFVSAYDHARRAVSFLRWQEDDVDEIAPSLYAGRNTRRKASDAQPATPAQPGQAPANLPVPSGTSPAEPPHGKTGVGLPGSEPFARP